jgi:hypothetical protein
MRAHAPHKHAAPALAVSPVTDFAAQFQIINAAGGKVTSLSPNHIVDRTIVGDSVDIELARLGIVKSRKPALRDAVTVLAGCRIH